MIILYQKLDFFKYLVSFFFRSKDDLSESVDGPRFTVHNNGSLEINSVEESDAGQYTCLAKNTEGSSAIDAMLYIKGKHLAQTKNVAPAASSLCN